MTPGEVLQFARAWASRHALITSETGALTLLSQMLADAERVLDERQAELDRDRRTFATKREQLRVWSEALELLKGSLAEQFVGNQIKATQ